MIKSKKYPTKVKQRIEIQNPKQKVKMQQNEDSNLDIIKEEISINNISDLNKIIDVSNNTIIHVNIRSLNANFDRLEILVERLKIKPLVIVCNESWNLEYYKYYQLEGYNIFYNDSKLNRSDGVVIFIKNSLNENTNVLQYGKLKILKKT